LRRALPASRRRGWPPRVPSFRDRDRSADRRRDHRARKARGRRPSPGLPAAPSGARPRRLSGSRAPVGACPLVAVLSLAGRRRGRCGRRGGGGGAGSVMERAAALHVGGVTEWTVGAMRLALVIGLLVPPTRYWFFDAGLRWPYIVVVAFAVSLFVVPIVRRYAIWRDVLDQPAARKVHVVATPLLGGAGVYLAFAITVLANFHFSMTLKGVALGASVVVALGILDDVAELPASVKLLGQIAG